VILLVLIALVARLDAAPGGAAVDPVFESDAGSRARQTAVLDEEQDDDDDDDGERDGGDVVADRDGSDREPTADLDAAGQRAGLDTGDAGAPVDLAPDDEDADALADLGLGEDAAAAGAAGAGALAMLDAELAPGDTVAGLDAADAGATAGAEEIYEQWMRHRRPSPWGRLDVGVSWRRRWSAPARTPASRHDEIWLVATWRR